jgi:hypothetical protein
MVRWRKGCHDMNRAATARLLINKQLTLPGGTYRRDRATEVPASKHAALASSTCRIRPSEVQTRIGQTPAAAVPHGPCTNVFAAVVKEMGLKLDLCPFCSTSLVTPRFLKTIRRATPSCGVAR